MFPCDAPSSSAGVFHHPVGMQLSGTDTNRATEIRELATLVPCDCGVTKTDSLFWTNFNAENTYKVAFNRWNNFSKDVQKRYARTTQEHCFY